MYLPALQSFVILVLLARTYTTQPVKCATPNSFEGECIYIDDCPSLQEMSTSTNLTSDDIIFLRRSQCDYSELKPKVCCPISTKSRIFHIPEHAVNRTHNESQNDTEIYLANRFKPDDGLPSLDDCGRQVFDNKIFNGEFTGIDEFPWMTLLEYNSRRINGHGFACGGALITDRFVVTAAHCVSQQNEAALGGLIGVRLGEHNIDTDIDCDEIYPTDCADPPINIGIDKKFIHPMYDEDSMDQLHDIALLKLSGKITFTDFIRPICLSTKLPPVIHDPGHVQYVAGWGQTEFGRSSPVKKKLKVPLVSESICADRYKPYNIRIGKRQLCAGGERDKDSCRGDSGGPLMVQAKNEKIGSLWYMTGVVSIGPTPCASNLIPGVYTKIQDYMDWLLDIIRKE